MYGIERPSLRKRRRVNQACIESVCWECDVCICGMSIWLQNSVSTNERVESSNKDESWTTGTLSWRSSPLPSSGKVGIGEKGAAAQITGAEEPCRGQWATAECLENREQNDRGFLLACQCYVHKPAEQYRFWNAAGKFGLRRFPPGHPTATYNDPQSPNSVFPALLRSKGPALSPASVKACEATSYD